MATVTARPTVKAPPVSSVGLLVVVFVSPSTMALLALPNAPATLASAFVPAINVPPLTVVAPV